MNTPPQIDRIPLFMDRIAGLPGVRLSSPEARGWARHARNPHQLQHAIAEAYHEVGRARAARNAGGVYDLDQLTRTVEGDPLAGGKQSRPRRAPSTPSGPSAPRGEWTALGDGRWRSPAGRLYGPQTPQAQRVARRLGGSVDTPHGDGVPSSGTGPID